MRDYLQIWDKAIDKEKFWLIFYDIETSVKAELIGIDRHDSVPKLRLFLFISFTYV